MKRTVDNALTCDEMWFMNRNTGETTRYHPDHRFMEFFVDFCQDISFQSLLETEN